MATGKTAGPKVDDWEDTTNEWEDVAAPQNASAEIKAKHAKNVSAGAAAYKPSWTESYETGYKQGSPSGMGAAMGIANVVGEGLKGAGDAITGIPETIKGIGKMAGEFVDPAAYKSVAENPIVDLPGKIGAGLITGTSEALISPRTTGKFATEALAPGAVVKGAKAATTASKAGAAYGARRLVSSVVKPSLKEQAFTKDPTGAILKHRVIGNSEKSMLGNVEGVVTKLNDDVGKNIAKSSAQVSPAEINGVLENTIKRVASQVGETNSTGIIGKLRQIQEQVMTRYGDRNLNLPEVHALRREIDDGISFTEDAVEKGVNKGKYEFRTGLNDIIERHVPGVRATNMDIASLLSAKEALTRRVNVGQNSNFFTPLTMLGEAATTLAGAPGAYLGTRLGMRAAGSTAVKSRAAQALESMSGRREPITPIKLPPVEGEVVAPGGSFSQTQIPAYGESLGSTYQAMGGRANLNQRMLGPGETVGIPLSKGGISPEASNQMPGGFSQLDEIQPSVDKIAAQARTNALAAQGYNPNQLFEGGRMADPAQLLQRRRMDPNWEAGRQSRFDQAVQGGIEGSERRWGQQLADPQGLLEAARKVSTEDIMQILRERGYVNMP